MKMLKKISIQIYFGLIFQLLFTIGNAQSQSLSISSDGDSGPTTGTNWAIAGNVLTVSGTADIQAGVLLAHLRDIGSLEIIGTTSTLNVSIDQAISSSFSERSLTIGSIGNDGNINVMYPLTISGSITLHGGTISIFQDITAVNDTISISVDAGGMVDNVMGIGGLNAETLILSGSGDIFLDGPGSNVNKLVAGSSGSPVRNILYQDQDSLRLEGIYSSGGIFIYTLSRDLVITQPVATTYVADDAIQLFSDRDALAGSSGDGNIKIIGDGVITIDSGARALLYSGMDVFSTGLRNAVGGPANVRRNFDVTTSRASISSTGKYALYRELPVSTVGLAPGTWLPLFKTNKFDPNDDTQAAVADVDLVGNSTNPMLMVQNQEILFDSPSQVVDNVYYFRVRIGASHSSGKLNTSFYLGLDTNDNGTADIFVEANVNKNNSADRYVSFHISDATQSGISPSETAWKNSTNDDAVEKELTTRDGFTNSYSVSLGSDTDDDDLDNSQTDSWLEFGFTEQSLIDFALNALSQSITGETAIALFTFTATSQTANGDIGGINDKVDDLTASWEDLGVIINSSLEELTSGEIIQPTVNSQTSSSGTPTVTGTWGSDVGGDDILTVSINGVSYTTSSGLTIDGTNWSVTVSPALTNGTYDVTATTSRTSTGESRSDATSNELIISIPTLSLTGPINLLAGSTSSNFTLTVVDGSGTPTNVTSSTVFSLSTSDESATATFTPSSLTISSGTSSTTFTYANTKVGDGTHTITATRSSGDLFLSNSASTNISVWAGPSSSMTIYAGNNQSAPAGTAVPINPSVLLSDTYGNPVPSDTVRFSVSTGGGTVVPTSAIVTGSDGLATVTSWTLGSAVGNNTLNASNTAISPTPLTFTATATDVVAPVITAGQTFTYAEGQSSGYAIGTVTATDAVGVTGFTLSSVTGSDASDYTGSGWFSISSAGVLSLTASGAGAVASNDYETDPNSFTLTVTAGDAAGNTSAAETVTVTITNVV